MARDDRRQARTPREQAEQDMAAARELIASGALSAGERALAHAALAQAAAAVAAWDLLAERLPAASERSSGEARELTQAMRDLVMGLRDYARR